MKRERLGLRIITPDGQSMYEKQVDAVVFRRKEKRFELGSEIAIFPLHAPTLIRIPIATVRYRKRDQTYYVVVGGGFVEVMENEVLVVTPRFEKIQSGDPAPSIKAKHISEQWRHAQIEFQREMVGYL